MWIELTDNPDSYMLLYDSDENNLPIKESEARVPMQRDLILLLTRNVSGMWVYIMELNQGMRLSSAPKVRLNWKSG